ncbi:MAG: hypothetical protein Q8P20_09640 [bacterium]|nr:hypothetical protein [bacterium]
MERSGSTLVTQVLKQLFPGTKVQKIHGFMQGAESLPIISTCRDFRDVMVSVWRVKNDISLKDLDNGRKMDPSDIDKYLVELVSKIKILNRMRKAYDKNLIVLKYEKFTVDYDYMFNELEVFFHASFNNKLRDRIKRYSSLDMNTKRSAKFSSFHNGNWDKITLIHGLHIYKNGQPGIWKQLVPANKHDIVNSSLKGYLKQWGYEV